MRGVSSLASEKVVVFRLPPLPPSFVFSKRDIPSRTKQTREERQQYFEKFPSSEKVEMFRTSVDYFDISRAAFAHFVYDPSKSQDLAIPL